MSESKAQALGGIAYILRILKHRNYRLFFMGQSISLIGTWIQQVAMSWLVYRLTQSPLMLGVVGFSSQLPALFLTPIGGVLADRWKRQRVLVFTQALSMLQALVLAVLVLSGHIAVWQLIVLGILLGGINAVDIPVRQALVIDLLDDRRDLGTAIAINSSMINGARLIGPAVAGVLIATLGEGACFLINGLSYLAVIAALLAMRIQDLDLAIQPAKPWQALHEGFRYAFGFAPIRDLLLLIGLVSLVGVPYAVLMPVFAKDILHGDSHTLGFLMGAAGLGALAGAIYLARRKTVLGLGRIIVMGLLLFGASLLGLAFSKTVLISLGLLILTGFGLIVQLASSNTIIQTLVDDDKRGRVMSFYTLAFMGVAPFGSIYAGVLANQWGASLTVFLGGLLCLVGAAGFALRLPALEKIIQPIYRRKGILPEIAQGIQSATALSLPPED